MQIRTPITASDSSTENQGTADTEGILKQQWLVYVGRLIQVASRIAGFSLSNSIEYPLATAFLGGATSGGSCRHGPCFEGF
ncbi:hypothetical protein [Pseudobacteriovorax antillogorgiicola]|uniref:hypothetical protein n=1 Tax=Pseudobacteriovorax antillogorgiicola TaxID=1513793 RepID=UPI0013565D95|nr:hypothetical protein [Pseudobacteriovorax antillogorgiicola]